MITAQCRCGGEAKVSTNGRYWYVECSRCPAGVEGVDQQHAITAWVQKLHRAEPKPRLVTHTYHDLTDPSVLERLFGVKL